jgi:transcriptional regulator with GAF, ATPase, and Fis domain
MGEAAGEEIELVSRPATYRSSSPRLPAIPSQPPDLSSERIRSALELAGGSVVGAARSLGITRFSLRRLMKKNSIDKPAADK